MTREEKLDSIVRLFSKAMFYGDWKWETPNERTIEMLMREVDYWPFEDEDDMIRKTDVDEALYQQARFTIPGRYVECQGDQDKYSEEKTDEKV